ncbi:MAG: carbamate kinase [Deltaproteobacteria bacterium]|nr:carbamate kinase [Deltaproteobacteria bacterium]
MDSKLIVLAIGGNSLIRDKAHSSVPDQYQAVLQTATSIAALLRAGHRVVVTHGNGPQVGFILRRSELASKELHEVPLDACGADTQGAIGYMIQRALHNLMRGWERPVPVATVVTQVRVDAADPAFQRPSKPIGSFMGAEEAALRAERDGWDLVEDAGRGWRRVVASPQPVEIVELPVIRTLVDAGTAVIAVGGGGIPVIEDQNGDLQGIAAVIDKDLASSMLATLLGADQLIISTAVDQVALNFGKPDERRLSTLSLEEAARYAAEGQFAPGSMLPKIEAMMSFVRQTGGDAILALPEHLLDAVEGRAGTRMTS